MSPERWQEIKEILERVIEIAPEIRAEFLAATCEGDAELQIEVESFLLEADTESLEDDASVFFGDKVYANQIIGKNIDQYKIISPIGEGGMGAVYLAEQQGEGFSQKVALKLIKRGMDTNAVLKRFFIERQILASLEHPNIARLLDGGSTADGLPYFVMEYIEGEPLRDFCDGHQFDTNERLEIFLKVCTAVTYAHQKLVVHRDIKPSNIIVTEDGTPKLLDFGIGKVLSPDWNDSAAEATKTQMHLMTPEYASPEQLRGQMTTTSTDVYSLGIVLYELLTGTRPYKFDSTNPLEISEKILTQEPVRPSAAVTQQRTTAATDEGRRNPQSAIRNPRSLKGDLDNIILKAIHRETDRRYQSIQEFAEDIRRHLLGLPVTATADSRFYRLSKFIRRHRRSVGIGLITSLVLLTVSGFAVWQGIAATRERQKAEKRLTEIRNVAKSLMNETNNSLAKIPGNVTVQKALAEKSVALLDSLAGEETKDALLLSELAESYTKLAEIQIWSFREYDNAIENLEKSETIFQKILQSEPDEIDIRRKIHLTQVRQIEALQSTNRRERMFDVGREIIKNQRELIRIEPENPAHFANLAASFGWFGDQKAGFGFGDEAIQEFEKGMEIIDQAIEMQVGRSNTAEEKSKLARLIFIKAWLLGGTGENNRAIENYLKTAELTGEVYEEHPDLKENFDRLVTSYQRIAEIYEKEKNYRKALENYQSAENWVLRGFQNRKMTDRTRLNGFQCFFTVYCGKMSDHLGNKVQARNYFIKGENACRRNIEQDANHTENIFDSLPFLFEIADFFVGTDEKERAVNQLLDLSRDIQAILEKNHFDLTAAFLLAETYEKIGDVVQDKRSRAFYEKAAKIWNEYSAENALTPNESKKMMRVATKLQ